MGRHEEAVPHWDKVLQDEELARSLYNFDLSHLAALGYESAGERLKEKGREEAAQRLFDKALLAYRKGLELYPDYARALRSQAHLLTKLGRRAEATPLFQRAYAAEWR